MRTEASQGRWVTVCVCGGGVRKEREREGKERLEEMKEGRRDGERDEKGEEERGKEEVRSSEGRYRREGRRKEERIRKERDTFRAG